LAKGLIETASAQRLVAYRETYSKFIHPADRSVRTIFGDGAAGTLISAVESTACPGRLSGHLSSARTARAPAISSWEPEECAVRRRSGAAICRACPASDAPNPDYLFMDGAEIFSFTLAAVSASRPGSSWQPAANN